MTKTMKLKEIIAAGAIVGVVVSLLAMPLGANVWFFVPFELHGQEDVRQTALELASNQTDTIEVLNRIANWENDNIVYDANLSYWYPGPPFMLWRSTDPAWIMTIKRGACAETASLFKAMAEYTGVQCRIVDNPGEDHSWCEVLVNNSWLTFDPGLPTEQRFNNSGFYERPSLDGWGKPLSYVYAFDSEGKEIDVTQSYTETGQLTIVVKKDNIPVQGVDVIIKSHSLMDNFPDDYKEPAVSLIAHTNQSGMCQLRLGGNNYTVVAKLESGPLTANEAESTIKVEEGGIASVSLSLKENYLSIGTFGLLFIAFATVLVCLIMVLLFRMLARSYLRQYVDADNPLPLEMGDCLSAYLMKKKHFLRTASKFKLGQFFLRQQGNWIVGDHQFIAFSC